MNDDMMDPLVERAAQSMRALPPANPLATMRIMAAVRARRAASPSRMEQLFGWLREPSLSFATAGVLAAAALVVGFVSRGALTTLGQQTDEFAVQQPNAGPATNAPLHAASNPSDIRSTIAVPVSMVFESADAESVSLVGDFNDWDATATPLHRFGANGPWTATVLAKPGRHTYAFLVNGTTLVADPRAPRAKDLDYGTEASVLMVNPQ
jgi:hypothetical protein